MDAAILTGIDATLSSAMATIHGVIRDQHRLPIANATVSITDGTSTRELRTANEPLGEFEFSGVAPGAYTLSALRPGSSPEVVLVDLLPGDVETVDIALRARASIVGTVLCPDDPGDFGPCPGIHVRLFDPDDFPARRRRQGPRTSPTTKVATNS